MNIYWKKVEGGATQEFAEIEDYIDESVPVWLPNPRKKEEQWMFPGRYYLHSRLVYGLFHCVRKQDQSLIRYLALAIISHKMSILPNVQIT